MRSAKSAIAHNFVAYFDNIHEAIEKLLPISETLKEDTVKKSLDYLLAKNLSKVRMEKLPATLLGLSVSFHGISK